MSVGSCDKTSVNEVVNISSDTCTGNELLVPSLLNSMEEDNLRLTSQSPSLGRHFIKKKAF